jgi:hypothetical protein
MYRGKLPLSGGTTIHHCVLLPRLDGVGLEFLLKLMPVAFGAQSDYRFDGISKLNHHRPC